jgi:UDP:flavonoid glycosyltransferase YjiC (YdhE family)
MTKILFSADTATFAHASRSMLLAHACAEYGATTAIATGELPDALKGDLKIPHFRCSTTDPKDFTNRILWGLPPFSKQEISRGVVEELDIIKRFSPNIIVSDLRVSTMIAATISGIPLISLTNSYWHDLEQGQIPEAPLLQMMKLLGVRLTDRLVKLSYPFSEKLILAPINTVRKKYRLPPYTAFRDIFLRADALAYCEPFFQPILRRKAYIPERYLGCVSWSARSATTDGFKDGRGIYVSLGSSGDLSALPKILTAVERLKLPTILSLAGRTYHGNVPASIQVASFVDPDRILPGCDLAITNGGSPSSLQAMSHGVPVVGITTNLDQILCMQRISQFGAGVSARACDLDVDALEALFRKVLSGPTYGERAKQFQTLNRPLNSTKELFVLMETLLGKTAMLS